MTSQLAKNQLSHLTRELQQARETVAEYTARIPVLEAQIKALEPLAIDESPKPPVVELGEVLNS